MYIWIKEVHRNGQAWCMCFLVHHAAPMLSLNLSIQEKENRKNCSFKVFGQGTHKRLLWLYIYVCCALDATSEIPWNMIFTWMQMKNATQWNLLKLSSNWMGLSYLPKYWLILLPDGIILFVTSSILLASVLCTAFSMRTDGFNTYSNQKFKRSQCIS